MNNAFKYIIFDFDGTLADTNEGIVKTFQETFRSMGKPVPSASAVTATIGLELSEAFRSLLQTESEEETEDAVAQYRNIFPSVAYSMVKAFPGVTEVLDEIRSRNIRMSLATSRSHRTLDEMVAQIGLTPYFDVMLAAEDVERHKPAPDLVNRIMEMYSLNPGDVLVVGDAVFDLMMGRAAGCKVCGVTWGNQSAEMLASVNPDYLIGSMKELPDLISSSL